MSKKYNSKNVVTTFKLDDLVTLAVPREDRAATDSLHLICQVIDTPYSNRHQLQTMYKILDKLFPTKVLNIVPELNWSTIRAEHFEGVYREVKNSKKITLHAAAAQEGRAHRIEISCNCTKQCGTKRCTCFKNNVECTQYCHSED